MELTNKLVGFKFNINQQMWLKFVTYIPTDALFRALHYLKFDHFFCP